MKHRLSTAADVDLEYIARWYEEADGLGDEFIEEFLSFVSILEANPRGFARAPRCPNGREIRVVKIGRFDYLLYHEVLPTEVVTIASTPAGTIAAGASGLPDLSGSSRSILPL